MINKKKYLGIITSFLLLSLISILLFLKVKFNVLYGAGDMQFHLRRIMELREDVFSGHLLPIYSFNYFHGSAVMGLYPYLSMYPFLLIVIIMHSFIHGYYVFAALCVFVTCLISFFSSLRYSKSILISYTFSILYSMSSTFTFELFFNGDLGVLTALVFLPLIVFGFLDLINGNNDYLKLVFGIVLEAFCQIPALTLIILFLILWSLINIKYIFKRNILLNFIKAAVLSVFLTSIMWLPLVKILLTNNIHTVGVMQLNGTSLKFFIENISIISIVSLILSLIRFRHFNRFNKQMYLISLLVIFISSKLMPWHVVTSLPLLNFFNQFQYSYRFLIIPQILLCYLFAVTFIKMAQNTKYLKYIFSSLLLFTIIFQLGSQFIVLHKKMSNNNVNINSYQAVKRYINYYSPNAKWKYSTHGYLLQDNKSIKYFANGYFPNSDYYPKASLKNKKMIHDNVGKLFNGHIISVHHYKNNTFIFNNKSKGMGVCLPFILYNHEQLNLYLNNKRIKWSVNKHNLLTLNHINKGKNLLKIRYVPDYKFNLIKYSLLMLGLLWILIYLYKRRNRNVKYNNTNL